METSNCLNCGELIEYLPSRKSGKYCSNKCQWQYKVKNRFKKGIKFNRYMRKYLLEVRGEQCECCSITEWNGKPLTFQIDHIDGNILNNELENLKILCPNCHTQTKTWGIKNISNEGYERMIQGGTKGGNVKNGNI